MAALPLVNPNTQSCVAVGIQRVYRDSLSYKLLRAGPLGLCAGKPGSYVQTTLIRPLEISGILSVD